MSKSRTIVLGGARSGKSGFAEILASNAGKPRIYLATAQAFDSEMRARIETHVSARGPGWRTIESPLNVATELRKADPNAVVLFDCVTLWLSNQFMAGNDLPAACDDLIDALMSCPADVVIVSNEVGCSIVPDTEMGRSFRDAQGILNQRLAALCDLAVLVVAGLPLALKGTLPELAP